MDLAYRENEFAEVLSKSAMVDILGWLGRNFFLRGIKMVRFQRFRALFGTVLKVEKRYFFALMYVGSL